jgi:hypothetical protein
VETGWANSLERPPPIIAWPKPSLACSAPRHNGVCPGLSRPLCAHHVWTNQMIRTCFSPHLPLVLAVCRLAAALDLCKTTTGEDVPSGSPSAETRMARRRLKARAEGKVWQAANMPLQSQRRHRGRQAGSLICQEVRPGQKC